MRPNDPIEAAMIAASVRVLIRRAENLRARAAGLITTVNDGRGRTVRIVAPEATVMLGTAAFLDECATDIAGAAR